jgi:uncharacterized protein YqgQ
MFYGPGIKVITTVHLMLKNFWLYNYDKEDEFLIVLISQDERSILQNQCLNKEYYLRGHDDI